MFHVKHFLRRIYSKTRRNGDELPFRGSGRSVEESEAPQSQERPAQSFTGNILSEKATRSSGAMEGVPQLGETVDIADLRPQNSDEKRRLNVSRETFSRQK